MTAPQSAALTQARENGLWGRADSPPDWQQALDGAIAGDPILVKDPTDPRDDFFLIPMRPANPAAHRTAWIMLDPATLKLREAALLDHWKFPAFPNGSDARLIAQSVLRLPDGTECKFPQAALKPNQKNLVWRAGDASILPYWPLKEWIAPHPITGEPVSIYVTQEGEVLTTLSAETPSAPAAPKKSSPLRLGLTLVAGVLIGAAMNAGWDGQQPAAAPTAITRNHQDEVKILTQRLAQAVEDTTRKEHQIQDLQKKLVELEIMKVNFEKAAWPQKVDALTNRLTEAIADVAQREKRIQSLTLRVAEVEKDATQKDLQIQIFKRLIAEIKLRKGPIDKVPIDKGPPISVPEENPGPSPALPLTGKSESRPKDPPKQ